jgi:uncharacterized membrane protein
MEMIETTKNAEYNKWLLYTAGAVIGAIPALLIKKYIDSGNFFYILGALIGYSILTYIYYKVFLYGTIGSVYTVMNIFMILFVFFAGIVVYNEQINLITGFGVLFAIFSIILLSK